MLFRKFSHRFGIGAADYFLLIFHDSALESLAALARQFEDANESYRVIWLGDGPIQGSFERAYQSLIKCGVPGHKVARLSDYWIFRIMSRFHLKRAVAICQTPYLNEHISERTRRLLRVSKLTYLNYALNVEKGNEYHYDLDSYKSFDTIWVASEAEMKNFVAAGVSRERLVISGNPVVQSLHGQRSKKRVFKDEIVRILWAPHWLERWENLGVGVESLHELLGRISSMALTIRPHPFLGAITGKELPAGYGAQPSVSKRQGKMLDELLSDPRVNISNNCIQRDIEENDVLLTDGVSIVAYWAVTGKPQLVIRRPNSARFVDWLDAYLAAGGFLVDADSVKIIERLTRFADRNSDQRDIDIRALSQINRSCQEAIAGEFRSTQARVNKRFFR